MEGGREGAREGEREEGGKEEGGRDGREKERMEKGKKVCGSIPPSHVYISTQPQIHVHTPTQTYQ